MLTSLSEQSTPAELSMKSVLIRPPRLRERDPRRLRHTEVGALTHRRHAKLLGIDAQPVVGRDHPPAMLFSDAAFT